VKATSERLRVGADEHEGTSAVRSLDDGEAHGVILAGDVSPLRALGDPVAMKPTVELMNASRNRS
jgi:hypothetical protein